MKVELYKVTFRATEKLSNGKERTTLQSVYIHCTDCDGQRITLEQQIERGTAALLAAGYYNIKYGSTIKTELIVA